MHRAPSFARHVLKRCSKRVVVAACISMSGFGPAVAQERAILRGVVQDSLGQPLADARVTIGTSTIVTTGLDGIFELVGVAEGTHVVAVVKSGFLPRAVSVTVTSATRAHDMGVVTLRTVPAGSVVLTGAVTEAGSGAPVPDANITVNGTLSGVSDRDGAFNVAVPDVAPGTDVSVSVRRIGYEELTRAFTLPRRGPEVELSIVLNPAPVELADITVEAEEAVPVYLRGFHERRDVGLGQYITAEEIAAMNPQRISDVLRRVRGLLVVGADGPMQEPVYRFHTSGSLCSQAVLYLDGVRVPAASLGMLAPPDRIAGIEAYRGSSTPPMFDSPIGGRTGCGAIAVWTKPPGVDGEGTSPFLIGLHLAGTVQRGALAARRFGGQLAMEFTGPFEFYPGFNAVVDGPGGGSGWQMLFNVRARPLGRSSPWYVGGGVTVIRNTDPEARAYPMLLTGLAVRVGRLRPFAELHAIDLTHPSNADLNIATGLMVQIGR